MDVKRTFLASEFIALNDEYTWLGNTIDIVFKTVYCTRVHPSTQVVAVSGECGLQNSYIVGGQDFARAFLYPRSTSGGLLHLVPLLYLFRQPVIIE